MKETPAIIAEVVFRYFNMEHPDVDIIALKCNISQTRCREIVNQYLKPDANKVLILESKMNDENFAD